MLKCNLLVDFSEAFGIVNIKRLSGYKTGITDKYNKQIDYYEAINYYQLLKLFYSTIIDTAD